MFNKFFTLIACLLVGAITMDLSAQSLQEVQSELEATKGEISSLEDKRAALEKQIEDFDLIGWKIGGTGGLGLNLAGFSDSWVIAKGDNTGALLGNLNVYANYNQDKWFLNNNGQLRLGYLNTVSNIADLWDGWTQNLDDIYLSSLYGYKLTDQLAVSALADARTSFNNFFDPALVTVGVGVTWTPSSNFVLVVHPLTFRGTWVQTDEKKPGYGFDDLSKNVQGDMGAKIKATYTDELLPRLNWVSDFTAFLNYGAFDLPEITWNNDFGYALSEFVTLNFGHTLRYYKPETWGNFVGSYKNADNLDYFAATGVSNVGFDGSVLDDFADFNSNDKFSYFQQKWLFTVGVTTTFNINKIPLVGDVND